MITKRNSWRSGAKVERKLLRQWFLKITDYAEELLNDLDKLTGWPERVKLMQANWIGKSTGAYLEFPIVRVTTVVDELSVGQPNDPSALKTAAKIGVYTTRPDTVYGVTYVVLAPEHPLTKLVTTPEHLAAVETFIQEVSNQSELERTAEDKPKRGIPTGGMAINPFTGEEIPIWIADYVLYEYGTGAVMGVPAHDSRDFKFAKEQNLPIKVVIAPPDHEEKRHEASLKQAYTEAGILVNSASFDGITSTEGKSAIIEYAEKQGFGKARVQYRLRDWLISRQRYWGTPIPTIYCPNCGTVPVPEEDLPVLLPDDVAFTGRGPSPLSQIESWVNVPCPTCGTQALRETDTMDTFIDSSWYFLRYPDAKNEQQVFDSVKTNDWMPVDQYVGGIEHAILHLLYSRFITKVLRDSPRGDSSASRGLLNFDEPFSRLLTQGMVQGVTYKNPVTKKYIPPAQVDPANPVDPETGEKLEVFKEKMSKSKFNGVYPEEVLGQYGADTARMFILFKAPPEKDLEWEDADVEGQSRFLNKVWRSVFDFSTQPRRNVRTKNVASLTKPEKELRRAIHTAIKEVTEDLEGEYQFNTAVSELMKLRNFLDDVTSKDSSVYAEGIQTLVLLLAPFAPHISEELWHQLGNTESVHTQAWPKFDPAALVADEITLVIQVNGKTRGALQVPAQADKTELEKYALESEVVQRHIEGKVIRKVIVVPGKLVNFVV